MLQNSELSGSLPFSIGALACLREFIAYENALTGALPATLGALTAMEVLDLSRNQLSGVLPPEMAGLGGGGASESGKPSRPPSLRALSLAFNALDALPAWIGDMPAAASLQRLDVSHNQLAGPLPASVNRLTALTELYLDSNMLEGRMPDMDALLHLRVLNMNGNAITALPAALPPHVGALWANNNNLHDPLPPGLRNLCDLEEFGVNANAALFGPVDVPPRVAAHVREEMNPLQLGVALASCLNGDPDRDQVDGGADGFTALIALRLISLQPGTRLPALVVEHDREAHFVVLGGPGMDIMAHVHTEDRAPPRGPEAAGANETGTFVIRLELPPGPYCSLLMLDALTFDGAISASYNVPGGCSTTAPCVPRSRPPPGWPRAGGGSVAPVATSWVWGVLRTAANRVDRSVNLTAVVVPEPQRLSPAHAGTGPYGSQRQYVVRMESAVVPAGTPLTVRLTIWRGGAGDWAGEAPGAFRLVPFLGEPAHLQVVSDDGSFWVHTHALDSAAGMGEAAHHPCHAPSVFSASAEATLVLPHPGVYRLFGQSAHSLDVIFYSFFLEAL